MFIDHSKIYVKAGDGGNGALSFHTEKYITNGGPDGGDGGDGGNVVLQAVPNLTSLQNFRFKHKFIAQNGAKGMSKKMYGKRGEDLIIGVPVGTVVKDVESGEIIADLTEAGQEIIVARGGKGGLGNMHYANSIRQAPQFATPGSHGEERELAIELKLIADVGDIPGIIENAHEGAGLGHDFLRHIERTRLLVHVVDLSGTDGRDPMDDFKTINKELEEFSLELASRPQIVVGNKCDGVSDEDAQKFVDEVKALGYEDVYIISAAGRIGIEELADKITEAVSKLPPTVLHDIADGSERVYTFDEGKKYEIIINEDGNFEVTGKWINKIFNSTNFGDTESTNFFQRTLENEGVFEELKKMGVKEGDTVKVCDLEFDYYD